MRHTVSRRKCHHDLLRYQNWCVRQYEKYRWTGTAGNPCQLPPGKRNIGSKNSNNGAFVRFPLQRFGYVFPPIGRQQLPNPSWNQSLSLLRPLYNNSFHPDKPLWRQSRYRPSSDNSTFRGRLLPHPLQNQNPLRPMIHKHPPALHGILAYRSGHYHCIPIPLDLTEQVVSQISGFRSTI